MANTHMAVIKTLDNSLQMIAVGSESSVRTHLDQWTRTHAVSFYFTPMILQIIDPAPEG